VPERLKRIRNFPWWGKPGAQWKTLGSDAYESKLINPETGNEARLPGETGELWIKSPSVIPGYYKQPDYTKRAFDAEGFCHVGDIFKIQDDPNFLSYFERAKDVIIRGGINLSASEIENIALGHESIAEAAAVSMADDMLGEKVCLYVVPRLGMKVTLEEITAFMLKQGIAKYKLPERIEMVDGLPRTPLGKVLKRELREDLKLKMAK
jgi:non-ribosomal peptide synthetase component E (peptide arylation enzyme)